MSTSIIKYFIDQLYDAAVVEPIKNGSDFLWHGVDETVIDGTINGSAGFIAWFSVICANWKTASYKTMPWPSSREW